MKPAIFGMRSAFRAGAVVNGNEVSGIELTLPGAAVQADRILGI